LSKQERENVKERRIYFS